MRKHYEWGKKTTFKVKYKANMRDNDDDPTEHEYTWESLTNYIVFLSLSLAYTNTNTRCVSLIKLHITIKWSVRNEWEKQVK